MPSGYTEMICNRKDVTFAEFLWRCTRGMGAMIMMRDHGLDAKIPDRFEPSDYHKKQIAAATTRLEQIRSMTDQEAEQLAVREYDNLCSDAFVSNKERKELAARYQAMIEQVEAWQPPSDDHTGLKEFMLRQLRESLDWDCGYESKSPTRVTGIEWRAEEIARLERDIEYHKQQDKEEIERTEARNNWLRQLRDSVAMPEKMRANN